LGGAIINGDIVGADALSGGLTAKVGWPRLWGYLALSLRGSSNEPGELSQWLAMMTAP